jgi:hyperosmotically inducible periplasmic protein
MKLTSSVKTCLLVGFALPSTCAFSNEPNADNSALNQRDQKQNTVTPDQQIHGSANDVKTTRLIRQALMKDDSLSLYAKNIKIITLKGKVTLRGPVWSSDEKVRVALIARRVVGNSNLFANDLEVQQ